MHNIIKVLCSFILIYDSDKNIYSGIYVKREHTVPSAAACKFRGENIINNGFMLLYKIQVTTKY